MPTSREHYENLLGPIYSWMAGGFESGVEKNARIFEKYEIVPEGSGNAVDLGSGCGFQSIPLARLGFNVTAIDIDRALLTELRENAASLPIKVVAADMLDFRTHINSDVELFVCMVDTLLHLSSARDVTVFLSEIFESLHQGGRLLLSFRDLTHELTGIERFIPVRSDDQMIFTCFLEYEPETVKVHDLLYQKQDDGWLLRKSYYRKLRLSPAWVIEALGRAGFEEVTSNIDGGETTILATRH